MVSLSSINKWILKPSIDRLNILKDDMWARSFNKKVSLGDKIGWSVRMDIEKAKLSSIASPYIPIAGMENLDVDAMNNSLKSADAAYESLINYLNSINYKVVNNSVKVIKRSGESLLKVAEVFGYLNKFGDVGFFFDKDLKGKVIETLASMEILLQKQIEEDSQESSQCQEFMSAVEANPAFRLLMDQYNTIISSLPSGLKDSLENGDISKIVNGLAAGGSLAATAAILGDTDFALDSFCKDNAEETEREPTAIEAYLMKLDKMIVNLNNEIAKKKHI